MPPFIDLTGRRFGRLTVLRRESTTGYGMIRWTCRCDCGNETSVFGNSLREGITQSCGCRHRDAVTKHGGTDSREFIVWQHMRQRCEDPAHNSYPSYGGRGIVVCERWRASFPAFLADMGPRPSPEHTIDRRDNERGYEPDNCYWATPMEQGRNKRNNRFLVFQGQRLTIAEWCRALNINESTLTNRIAKGLSVEEALSRPVAHKRGYARVNKFAPKSVVNVSPSAKVIDEP